VKKSPENAWRGNPYRRPGSPFWSFVYKDESGTVRRRSAKTRDLRIAREMLTAALRQVELIKAGHVDRYADSRTMPLADLVADYEVHLKSERCAAKYVKNTIRMLRHFLKYTRVTTIPSIGAPDAERFTTFIRSTKSTKTRDHHAGALRGFGKWLERTGRWDRDPFHGLRVRTANRDKFRIFKRVSFRYEEAEKLVEAVWARHEAEVAQGGMPTTAGYDDSVRDRQVLYWFALTTAFRANECASILWEDVTLDGKLAVRLAGKFTKNGDDAMVPLQPFVAQALRKMRARRSALQMRRGDGAVLQTDAVFKLPSKLAEIVRKDAAFAGLIPQKSPTSKRVDFHALRKSCARILIELNVHPKVIQQTLRHSDIRLTMDLYGELGEDDLFRELPGKFPVPAMFAESTTGGGAVATATA
jgi:integrase